jgi:hypothetical protein
MIMYRSGDKPQKNIMLTGRSDGFFEPKLIWHSSVSFALVASFDKGDIWHIHLKILISSGLKNR